MLVIKSALHVLDSVVFPSPCSVGTLVSPPASGTLRDGSSSAAYDVQFRPAAKAAIAPAIQATTTKRRDREDIPLMIPNSNRAFATAIAFLLVCGCKKGPSTSQDDKTTHQTSASMTALSEKQAFVERYVTFRRQYTSLDFKIDYQDDTSSRVPGPSSTSCDIRLYARVPDAKINEWTAGMPAPKAEAPTPSELAWVNEIPNAPKSIAAFTWYTERDKTVGVAKDEVLYRVVCARN